MPKHRRKILRRTVPIKVNRDILQRQLTCVQKDKENSLSTITEGSGNDPLLSYMKIEVKEELDSDQQLELSEEINIPLKIEEFETLDYDSINIKQEESPESERHLTPGTSNNDLNILIEWALNLQYDHSKHCKGRLYPCKEIFDNFRCKIVVLYCTVCKKRMLHTLKDWAM
ncbi:hypothetical protein Zmor_009107 [Zophobas morio]|uniref:Uncharacterized protein n=1 Tax=Zophobas morio TaxID=2755281 RepID=A0AA38MI30_9CUCU|nr:hypothetical protein Zmor_009107 [Zophobas morio]